MTETDLKAIEDEQNGSSGPPVDGRLLDLVAEVRARFTEAEVRALLKLVDWDGYNREELEAALAKKAGRSVLISGRVPG